MSEPITATLPVDRIREYCAGQPIRRLSVFGSAARNELTPESDIDLLVEYMPEAPVGYFSMARHTRELSEICGRDVDLCTPNGLSKYIRDAVLESARLIYELESRKRPSVRKKHGQTLTHKIGSRRQPDDLDL